MSSIVIAGDTSGTVTLSAPAVAGSAVLTLPTTSGTLYATTSGGAIPVASGGTGATTLTGYVKGTGTAALTGSATVPGSDVSGNITGNAANVTGTVAVANGGTGLTATPTNGQLNIGNGTGFTRAALTAGSGISITNGAGSISIAATGGGTVTSVATGNGLSGGTITSTGTLVVACPAANTVGSYCSGAMSGYAVSGAYVSFTVNFGSNYAAGSGNQQMQCASVGSTNDVENPGFGIPQSLSLSGTWKWLGANTQVGQANAWVGTYMAVACRVS